MAAAAARSGAWASGAKKILRHGQAGVDALVFLPGY